MCLARDGSFVHSIGGDSVGPCLTRGGGKTEISMGRLAVCCVGRVVPIPGNMQHARSRLKA